MEKRVEDISNALGDGYAHCLERVFAAGFDPTGHSFTDYIRDYPASHHVKGNV